ncbi:MAG TPA: head-tail connector protein [Hypericibacter adhaerens]|uniref:head-tail connector protein n=1 Tax=Hypericibacter adhaerens TaxID=2602016 RepID=UPI002D02F3B3|nr:head-tail connector protein [Hypericibacter adhaerens]HWA42163.1 head-tail connector protein [Hypericibacter adhaerens]
MTSTLIAGPGEEPVTLAEAKAFCRIDTTDEDALISALIAAARLQVESLTGRALVTQSWRLAICPRGLVVELPVIPVSALTAAPDGAILQGDAVLLASPETGEITIDYTAGYGGPEDVPGDLKQAVLLLVAFWFENRDSPEAAPVGFERLLSSYARVRL